MSPQDVLTTTGEQLDAERAADQRQEFVDQAAMTAFIGRLGAPEDLAAFALDVAEALWKERERRRAAR